MTTARLYQTATGIVDGDGTVDLEFPPVPAGLAWTGSITLFTPVETALVITQGVWTATRNGQPLATYGGTGILAGIQLVSLERLTITGTFLPASTEITATWTGRSDALHEAPLVAPHLYGALNPFSQIYTDQAAGPGSALQTIPVPAPSALQASSAVGLGTGTTNLIPVQAEDISLWAATLSGSLSQSASTVGDYTCSFVVQTSGGTEILRVDPLIIQADSGGLTASIHTDGLYLPAGETVDLVIGATTASALRGSASVVYGPRA